MKIENYTSSTASLDELASQLSDSSGPMLVVTHAKPDGDAFGSTVALVGALRQLGKEARGLFVPPLPRALAMLPGADLADIWNPGDPLPFEPDRLVVVDTGAWSQIGPLRPLLEPLLPRTLVIDHHLSGDIDAPHRWVEGEAAAACEMVAQLIDRLLPDHDAPRPSRDPDVVDFAHRTAAQRTIDEALFVGIASDTGWFRFSNARPQTHLLAADLIGRGVDHASLYQRLEQSERPEKLALLTRALQSLTYHADGRAAVMGLTRQDFEDTGALLEDSERLIDFPQMVGRLQVIALATETLDDEGQILTRVSFRSKHAADDSAVNVAELAGRFGGGGHARAAGAKLSEPLEAVRHRLATALAEA